MPETTKPPGRASRAASQAAKVEAADDSPPVLGAQEADRLTYQAQPTEKRSRSDKGRRRLERWRAMTAAPLRCAAAGAEGRRSAALADLAGAIEAEHQAAHGAARAALDHALECGRLLLEAKAQLPHGSWLDWLERNTSVSARQSQRYMRLAAARFEGRSDVASHLTIEGALSALADRNAPREHPARAWTIEQRRAWFASYLIDRRAWAIYLDADRMALPDIAAFIGEPEATARALIRPRVDPGWHWDLDAEPKDAPEARRFHDLARRSIAPLIEFLIQSIRHHALPHAEQIGLYEDRDDLAPVLDTMLRECIARADSTGKATRLASANLPRPFAAGLYGAAAHIAVSACTEPPAPPRGHLWFPVGLSMLYVDSGAVAWADRYGAAALIRAFQRIADGIRDVGGYRPLRPRAGAR
jgi:hypothetical protein